MSDSNRVELLYPATVESTFGTTPASAYHLVRYTGESLKGDTASTNSNEIRADRNITSIIRTGLSGSGDINIEWSANPEANTNKALTLMLLDALQNSATTWGASDSDSGFDTTVASKFTKTTHGITIGASGDYIVAYSASTPKARGIYKLTGAITANDIPVTPDPQIAAGNTVTDIILSIIPGGNMRWNGTTMRHRTVFKNFADISGSGYGTMYGEQMPGFTMDGFSINIPTDGILTGSFAGMFSYSVAVDGVSKTGTITSVVTQSTDQVMESISNTFLWYDDGTLTGQAKLTNFTLQQQNNLRARLEIGTLGAESVGTGFCQVSGTLQAYFRNGKYLLASTQWKDAEIVVAMIDSTGRGWLFRIPKIKISSVQQVAGGVNQDVIVDMQWSGFVNSVSNTGTLAVGAFLGV